VKLCYFNDYRLGVIKGDTVVDVTDTVKDIPHVETRDLMIGLIAAWDSYKAKVEKAAAEGKAIALSGVRLRPPVPKPGNIVCMAVNYMEDGTLPAKPAINAFHKAPTAIIGDGDAMVLPDAPATIFEGEAEVALIIGKRATRVPLAEAMTYVFGYTCFIDGSARGLPPPGNVFFQMKSRDTFAPIGPWIVTADEIANPQKLDIVLTNNEPGDAEVQHRRHGAPDPALHRVAELDPYARARRRRRHRHQPSRPQRLHGWRQDRAYRREDRHAACHHRGQAQAHLGAHDAVAAQGEWRRRRAHAATHGQIRLDEVGASRLPATPSRSDVVSG
jgi:2-keto-4-pentenoate hydratase/2-oxohepta-3-ene-1,7-dioic acid hydratase in catechol pathway